MPAACPVQFFRLQMDGDGVFAAAKSERYAIECPLIGKRSDRPWFDGILPLWASAPFEWVEAGRGFPFFCASLVTSVAEPRQGRVCPRQHSAVSYACLYRMSKFIKAHLAENTRY